MSARRVAIVVQRYGPDVDGGAESAARWLAENLVAHGQVEVHVLTSCARDYTTWDNLYPPGRTELNGVHLHRFTVDAPRNWQRSQKETGRFLLGAHTVAEEMDWIRREGPFCSNLLRHVARHATHYHAFIFFTYLYATSYFALPLVAHKSILVPAAHDEPFLYLNAYRALLHMPRHIVFLTAAEQALVHRVAGNAHIPSTVAAVGLQPPPNASSGAAHFRARHGLEKDFLLYGGRIDEAKNVPRLLDDFLRYSSANGDRDPHRRALKLVLMGRPHMPLPNHPRILPLGFVSDAEKFEALEAATVVVLPSHFESLSIMVLESWLVQTPVLVNGRSEVLKQQARHSNGGLYYTSYEEFEAALDLLLQDPGMRRSLGRQGRRFVADRYDGAQIMAQYRAILDEVTGNPPEPPSPHRFMRDT